MAIVWLESLGDLQRDRDSSTFVLEQINTAQQRSRDPSNSSTNSLKSAGSSASTNLQQQHSKQPWQKLKIKIYQLRKSRAPQNVRIIETLESVQADLK